MYKTKVEEGKDDPRTIWIIFREFGASKKSGILKRKNIWDKIQRSVDF